MGSVWLDIIARRNAERSGSDLGLSLTLRAIKLNKRRPRSQQSRCCTQAAALPLRFSRQLVLAFDFSFVNELCELASFPPSGSQLSSSACFQQRHSRSASCHR